MREVILNRREPLESRRASRLGWLAAIRKEVAQGAKGDTIKGAFGAGSDVDRREASRSDQGPHVFRADLQASCSLVGCEQIAAVGAGVSLLVRVGWLPM